MTDEQEKPASESISGNLAVCAFISRSLLFKKLAKEDLGIIYENSSLHKYSADQIIMHEGDPGKDVFLLMSGNVKVETEGKQGVIELAQLSRGAFFGEVSLLTGRPRTATVTAADAVEVIAIKNKDLEGILRRYPKVRKLMQTIVEGRVRTAIEKTQE
ncbi:MAG: cyclic nucleotide-binding domain-containing protein [Deltaproteobacteria bacterium]|nr:cyclic nucleotide-binding domain-containing protein [Deltaproteobacteria bacterium]